jgi:signal transduction histidine kinase
MTTTSPDISARARAAGALALLVAALTTVIVVVCTFNSVRDIGRPFPGFFVWENLFVPAAGSPGWSGPKAGLPYHSWLEQADGRVLADGHDVAETVAAAVAARGPRATIHYRARKHGEVYDVEIPVMRFGPGAYLGSTAMFAFNALALLALGWTVLYLKPVDAGARAVFYFCMAQAGFLSMSIDLFGPYWFRPLYFFYAGSTPAATFAMISFFPVDRTRRSWESPALGVALGTVAAFGIGSNWSFWNDQHLLLTLDTMVHLSMATCALAAFVFFASHFARTRSHAVRQRTKVVLFGSLLAFLPTMLALVGFYSGLVSIPFNFLALPFVFFPVAVGYAVAKHDLFDVDRVIKRTIVYASLSAFVLVMYSLGIGLFDWAFENANPFASRLAEGALIVTLITLTNPSRRRIQDIVDRLYDRQHYDYREVVPRASRSFTTMLEMERLVPAALELIDQTIQPERVALYTVESDGMPVLRGSLVHEAGALARLELPERAEPRPALAAVARVLGRRDVLDAESDAANAEETAATNALAASGMRLAAAMPLEQRVVGMVLCGPRRTGAHLSGDDVALLRTIADQLAIALENARSYRTIGGLNRDLADKNVALEKTYDDLRAAQQELVAKERLAAIGELAGAVAHTIRNPLAGMRATAQLAMGELGEHPTRELVEDFISETDRLNDRISSLLDFARPFEPDLRDTTLEEVIRGALESVRAKADQRRIRLRCAAGGEALPVRVDPALFEQLTVELLANAADAAPEGSTVIVETGRSDDGGVWMEVRDGGPGVPAGNRIDLFRLFFTTKKSGTGFGLATAKKVVERHGGTIEVDDAPEGGACFRVRLPAAAARTGDQSTSPPSYLAQR